MQAFGPENPIHRRVPWKKQWELTSIMIPIDLMGALMHNDTPSAAEISQVGEFREHIQEAMRINHEKIQLLYEEISRLKEIESQFQKQRYACDVIMSPIRNLPDDIIYKIVTSDPLLPDGDDYTDPAIHVPSTLAQVCISWRNVVHSIPSLWNRMCFDCAPWDFGPTDILFDRINRFGQLSGSLPVSIHLEEAENDPDEPGPHSLILDNEDIARKVAQKRAFPRVTEWLFGNWAFRNRLVQLSTHVSFPSRLYNALISGAEQGLITPTLNTLLMYPGPWVENSGQKELRLDVHKLLDLLPNLSRFWFSTRSINCCSFFDGALPLSPTPFLNLRFIYLESKIKLPHWEKSLELLPNLEAAWYTVQIPRRAAIDEDDAIPPINHHHIKELNLQVSSISWLDSEPAAFPLALMRFPTVTTLCLYFPASSIGLKFTQGDYLKAFPSLTHLSVQLTWTSRRWPLEDLCTYLFAFPTSTTSITFSISISQPSFGKFATAIETYSATVFARPNLLFLDFKFKFDHLWRSEWEKRIKSAISKLLAARKPGSTFIKFSIKPRDDSSEWDSEDTSDDSSAEELEARTTFVRSLPGLGYPVDAQMMPFLAPLDVSVGQFKERYFV
ncbi:hypothetical protein BJ165DRAFT_1406238 [Panaeolus papilionaceus]|nr:hypothetical protein BJ165DRAFT_1406238 [Panaeolus papilionaceus]